jgi:hypothetical protein
MSHPNPNKCMLIPYMSNNLAKTSRYWMGKVLLTGDGPLLPPILEQEITPYHRIIQACSRDLIQWQVPSTQSQSFLQAPAVTVPVTSPFHRQIGILPAILQWAEKPQRHLGSVPLIPAQQQQKSRTRQTKTLRKTHIQQTHAYCQLNTSQDKFQDV